ncbi:hypothetical protein JGS22_017295 [Streptomyces sp. P38-E01]|uniref:Uncharacterized protein n=1 Tax=Streptomyces tardus TaxID=2780544 RepID=A0A949JH29_9ACTN|nr:hypothetical protein [Streptomyces tardus]MBU7599322.1 hypothetical protein [Streptomyces tardus]
MSEVAEPRAEFFALKLIVEGRDDAALTSEVLGGVRNKGERPVLVDARGEVYRDGIDDFRRNNEIFATDDKFVYNRNWEDESAKLDLVTVSARIEPDRTPWYLAGGAVVVLTVGGLLLWRLRARRRLEAHFDAQRRQNPGTDPMDRTPTDREPADRNLTDQDGAEGGPRQDGTDDDGRGTGAR